MAKQDYTFRYRARNWSDYNRALINRGRLTLWFDEEAVSAWRNTSPTSGPGAPRTYSDTAIECALVVKAVFHLSLRATQGLLDSLVQLLALELPVPDYSTVSRRQGPLSGALSLRARAGARHLVVDATGLKIYGAGEWHSRRHRQARRRRWRKLHLGIDERTKEIVAVEVTPSTVHDSRVLPTLLDQVPGQIGQVSGDRGYDTSICYQSVINRGAAPTILPRRNARLCAGNAPPAWRGPRDATLRQIMTMGRYAWRVTSGCTRQSLAENAVSRFKALFGPKLSARRFDNQRTEAMIKCSALNRMTHLGMPHSVRIQ